MKPYNIFMNMDWLGWLLVALSLLGWLAQLLLVILGLPPSRRERS